MSSVGGDPLGRHARTAVTDDSHNVLAELLRERSRHSNILSARPSGQAISESRIRAADLCAQHGAPRGTTRDAMLDLLNRLDHYLNYQRDRFGRPAD